MFPHSVAFVRRRHHANRLRGYARECDTDGGRRAESRSRCFVGAAVPSGEQARSMVPTVLLQQRLDAHATCERGSTL